MKKLAALAFLLGLAFSTNAALGDPLPVDPTVIINKTHDPTEMFSTNSEADPLVITLNSQGVFPPVSFEYTGKTDLAELWIELDGPFLGEVFACHSNIFLVCDPYYAGSDSQGLFLKDGVITPQEDLTVQVATPEPTTLTLLLVSGVFLIGLGRKWHV
jgi:hypothetical protein